MTNQQIFDLVAKGLIAQGCASVSVDGECLYRGPNGTKCAVGLLLTDKEYLPEMEGYFVAAEENSMESAEMGDMLPDRLQPFRPLLSFLQQAHDEVLKGDDAGPDFEGWKMAMHNIATTFSLSPAALDTPSHA